MKSAVFAVPACLDNFVEKQRYNMLTAWLMRFFEAALPCISAHGDGWPQMADGDDSIQGASE